MTVEGRKGTTYRVERLIRPPEEHPLRQPDLQNTKSLSPLACCSALSPETGLARVYRRVIKSFCPQISCLRSTIALATK